MSFLGSVGRFFDRLGDSLNRIPTYQRTLSFNPDYKWQRTPEGYWLWPDKSGFVWSEKREWRAHRYFGYHPINWYFVARRFDRFRQDS